ncbi:MAG: hypothetical protein OEQ13_15095, partial [Acidobacteriota bacterium]|nr:hypothetical protein [Acidobacteriota bacterium]
DPSEGVYLSEQLFQTYREGRWKAARKREDDQVWLFDLELDPEETKSVAAERADVAARLGKRIDELARRFAAEAESVDGLSEEDLARLRSLGYAE